MVSLMERYLKFFDFTKTQGYKIRCYYTDGNLEDLLLDMLHKVVTRMKHGKMNHPSNLVTIAKLENNVKNNCTAPSMTCISPEWAAKKKAVGLIDQIVAPRNITHKIRCKWNNVPQCSMLSS